MNTEQNTKVSIFMQFVFQKFDHEMKRKLLVQCIYISVLFVKEAFLHFPEKKQPRFHKRVIQKQKLPKLLS